MVKHEVVLDHNNALLKQPRLSVRAGSGRLSGPCESLQ